MEKSTTAEMEGISPSPTIQQQQQQQQQQPATFRRRRVIVMLRGAVVSICLCLIVFTLFKQSQNYSRYTFGFTSSDDLKENDSEEPQSERTTSVKIPLEAHVMSKCPDAQACLQKLIVPAMEQIDDKVDFRLSFIGNASSSSDAVSCMHGPGECIGDMLILCAANLQFPFSTSPSQTPPPIRSLGFANCLMSSYEHIPERALVEDCASEHGIDFAALNRCASRPMDGGEDDASGLALLRESFQRSAELGVTKSCTVRVDEKLWCIRDGGQWKQCGRRRERRSEVSTLVGEIERLWRERN